MASTPTGGTDPLPGTTDSTLGGGGVGSTNNALGYGAQPGAGTVGTGMADELAGTDASRAAGYDPGSLSGTGSGTGTSGAGLSGSGMSGGGMSGGTAGSSLGGSSGSTGGSSFGGGSTGGSGGTGGSSFGGSTGGSSFGSGTGGSSGSSFGGSGSTGGSSGAGGAGSAMDGLKNKAGEYADQASGKAREYADTAKDKAADGLHSAADAARDVANKLAETQAAPVADYARRAAEGIDRFSDTLKQKSLDELLGDVRSLVRQNPTVAVGAAAVVGFAIARFLKATPENEYETNYSAGYDDDYRA